MQVRVRLLGSLRPLNLPKEVELELPTGSNLAMLVGDISEKFPNIADALRSPSGNLMIINGVEAGNLLGLATPLDDGSEVVLIPVTHGG